MGRAHPGAGAADDMAKAYGMPVFVVMGCIMGALQGGLASGMLPTFSELFPTKIRATGQGFCLSGGRCDTF